MHVIILAALCVCSVKSHNKLAELTKQAKDALGITTVTRHFTSQQRLAVWQWHKDRLDNVELCTIVENAALPITEPVNQDVELLGVNRVFVLRSRSLRLDNPYNSNTNITLNQSFFVSSV